MKKMMAVMAAVLITIATLAQRAKDVPAFGKVEKSDLEMKECDFDKKADALVLFDVGELFCNIMGDISMEMERHIRIKILKDKGKDRADIHLPFLSFKAIQGIKNLQAQTYNLDEAGNIVVSKVEKKLIYEKKTNKQWSEMVFTFPEVKAGSIIEYKFTSTYSDFALSDWTFQKSIPVRYSRYQVDFPREIEVYATPQCSLEFEKKTDTRANRDIQTWSMKNVPALRDEAYISCDDDYLQRLEVRLLAINPVSAPRRSLVSNWIQVIRSLMDDEDFGLQLKRNIPRTADLEEQLKAMTDPYTKMVTIHNYVRKNMEWNGFTGIWANDGVRAAWKDRKGTTGEINMILVNLLKDAGLDCKPLLVSTRNNGRVNTGVADTRQFNKVMAHVTIGDKVYVLDGTEKYTPSKLIPYEVMYSEGLVINKIDTYDWGWTVLWDDKQMFRDVVVLQANIDEGGLMKGQAVVTSYDYSRVTRIPDAKKDQKEYRDKYFTSNIPGIQVDDLTLENVEADTLPLVQKMGFSMPVSASGNYKYFTINMFTGLEKNPFLADTRFSDVFFGANQTINLVANITIPQGYVFEALPKNLRMIMPDTSISITRRIAAEKNQLSARIMLEFKKPFYTVDEYPEFQEFYKRLFDLLNEQIAIRKETNP
jgi:hypothetical protein